MKLDKIFNYIFGFSSILSFIATIVYTIHALNRSKQSLEYNAVLLILSGAILSILLAFIFMVTYYSKKNNQLVSELENLPLENQILDIQNSQKDFIIYHSANSLFNILHYHSRILFEIDDFLESKNFKNQKDRCEELLSYFDKFIITFLTNLKSYFDLLTDDSCATCIKIVKGDKVKTFYRDPISHRDRKKSDYDLNGNQIIYNIHDNTAFSIIANDDYKEISFLCDDLKNNNLYHNKNPEWRKLYNATAVVPISMKNLKAPKKRDILGFICVDNFQGGFEQKFVENFLSGLGDLLFLLFKKYDKLTSIALKEGANNERLQTFSNWN